MDDIRREIMRKFTDLPSIGLEENELTDRDKLALAIAAGEEVDFDMSDANIITVRTRYPVGVVKINGKFHVYRLSDELKREHDRR